MIREYLAGTAQRELEGLRAELDVRLSALEAALARRDPRKSLELLVLDLARAATAEAESAAARASLEAQLYAQERGNAAAHEVQRALEAEHAVAAALQIELRQAQTALEAETQAAVRLRQELADLRKSSKAERQADAQNVRSSESSPTLGVGRDVPGVAASWTKWRRRSRGGAPPDLDSGSRSSATLSQTLEPRGRPRTSATARRRTRWRRTKMRSARR